MSGVKISFRVLWQFVSEYSPLKPESQVRKLLEENQEFIRDSLAIYASGKAPVAGASKAEATPKKKSENVKKEFIGRLATFLGLSEEVATALFGSYVLNDYRGSQKDLKKNITDERISPTLILKIRDFYYSERLYLLHLIRTLLTSEDHQYAAEYSACISNIGLDVLADQLKKNLETVTRARAPTRETNGSLVTNPALATWALQNLREQCHLLDLTLLVQRRTGASTDRVLSLAKLFKEVAFGRYLPNRQLLQPSVMDSLICRLAFAQSLIIIDALDLPGLIQSLPTTDKGTQPKQPKTTSLRNSDKFAELEKILCLIAEDSAHFGPLMLSVFLVKSLSSVADGATRKLGAKAFQLNVFQHLLQVLSLDPYAGNTKIASMAACLCYQLLDGLLHLNIDEVDAVHLHLFARVLKDAAVAETFWKSESRCGVHRLLEASLCDFPLDLTSSLKILSSAASASKSSLDRCMALLTKSPTYLSEVTDRMLRHLEGTASASVVRVACPFAPCPTMGLVALPVGTMGEILETMEEDSPQRVRFETVFNAIDVFVEIVTEVNNHVQYGLDSVSSSALERVSSIASFCAASSRRAVEGHPPDDVDDSLLDRLEPLVRALVTFLGRFAALPSPPLEALASALDSAACLARARPMAVWSMFQQQSTSSFLPLFASSSSSSSYDVSSPSSFSVSASPLDGRGLLPGSYGNILATQECAQARYPLTAAFLDLVLAVSPSVLSSADADLLVPSIVFVLREIFPHFGRWRFFGDHPKKEIVGQKCLEILLAAPADSTAAILVRRGLVQSPAGETLVGILATGVDVIQTALHGQGDLSSGNGADLVRLVLLAFRLLTSTLSRSDVLEGELGALPLFSSSSSSSIPNVVSSVASYIFLRYDPSLPRLAVVLLRQLASSCRMSLLASFGGDADVIRDALVRCLKSYTEDIRLKVAIFEFLTSCVRHQPGLIECFLDIDHSSAMTTAATSAASSRAASPAVAATATATAAAAASTSSSATPPPSTQQRSFSPGKNSFVPAMVSLIEASKQGTFQCPAPLLLAVGELALALWVGGRETAVDVIGKMPGFWTNVTSALFKKDAIFSSTTTTSVFDTDADARLKSAVVALGILAIQLYNKGGSGGGGGNDVDEDVGAEFLGVVEKLMGEEKLVLWLSLVGKVGAATEEESGDAEGKTLDAGAAALTLLTSVQRLVLVTTSLKGKLAPTSSLKNKLVNTAAYSLKEILDAGLEENDSHQLGVLMSSLLFQMVKHWRGDLKEAGDLVSRLDRLLVSTFANVESSSPQIRLAILGCSLHVVQTDNADIGKYGNSLLRTLGSLIQVSLRSAWTANATPEDETLNNHVNLTTIGLLHEAFDRIEDVDSTGASWLQAVGGSAPVFALLAATQHAIQTKPIGGEDFVQATLLLFCSLAKRRSTAEALHACGITEHLVIALANSYKEKATEADLQGWRLALRLYDSMLRTLQMRFLKDAFDMVGCHHERLLVSLQTACSTLEPATMDEAAIITQLLYQLAGYVGQWHLQLPHTFSTLLNSVLMLFQTAASLLQKPTLLQQSVANEAGDAVKAGSRPGSKSPSPGLVSQVQLRLLYLVAGCLSVLRRFTPNLAQVLSHPVFDLTAWPNLVSMSFSASDSEMVPSFGTLLGCVTSCSSILSKLDPLPEVAKSTTTSNSAFLLPTTEESKTGLATLQLLHQLLNYILENALHVALTQCARHLRDASLTSREKQLLKRELATELNTFLSGMTKVVRKSLIGAGSSSSPKSKDRKSSSAFSSSTSTLSTTIKDHQYINLVNVFIKQVLNK